MTFKDFFATKAEVEMTSISGTVRVEIHSHASIAAIALEAVWFIGIARAVLRRWHSISLFDRTVTTFVLLSALAGLVYLVTRTELIEFNQQSLTIRRNILGWDFVSRYPVDICRELSWCVQDSKSKFGLECKCGWRKVRFARNATEEQAREILALLQHSLPEVAQRMGMMPGSNREHFTRLGLG